MFFFLLVISLHFIAVTSSSIVLDDSHGPSRVFHGLGGLSGGGATSVFLRSYPEPQRSEILDYLFKPNYGASLQILKVEIGGEGQSTDGSEASHWRDPTLPASFERGYEWWLMTEAKKRNPNITLYGLPWTWPRWVACAPGVPLGNCTQGGPFSNITQAVSYITSWVSGARTSHSLDIDWLGVWNERTAGDDYVQALRASLDGQVSARLPTPPLLPCLSRAHYPRHFPPVLPRDFPIPALLPGTTGRGVPPMALMPWVCTTLV